MNAVEMINASSVHWARFMLGVLLETSVVFAFIGCLWLALRRKAWVSPQLGYYLFLLVLVKALIPGGISIPGVVSSLFPEGQTALEEEGTLVGGWGWLFGAGGPGEDTLAERKRSNKFS